MPRTKNLAKFLVPPTVREKAALAQLAAPTRIIGYCRVSTDDQAENGQSLDVQQRQLEGWAMQRGSELTEVVVEPGVSGGIPFAERPEGGNLWAGLQKGDVAAKLDRMSAAVPLRSRRQARRCRPSRVGCGRPSYTTNLLTVD
jgi:hypothetical protein